MHSKWGHDCGQLGRASCGCVACIGWHGAVRVLVCAWGGFFAHLIWLIFGPGCCVAACGGAPSATQAPHGCVNPAIGALGGMHPWPPGPNLGLGQPPGRGHSCMSCHHLGGYLRSPDGMRPSMHKATEGVGGVSFSASHTCLVHSSKAGQT